MAQYSIIKNIDNNLAYLVATGNSPAPLSIAINIKIVVASADSIIIQTDYFPIGIKTTENTITYGTTATPQGTTPSDVANALNNYLFPKPVPTESKVNGYASVGTKTTGGEGGKTVTVTTLSEFKAAAASTSPLIIKVTQSITGTGNIPLKSNKTVLGVNGATLNGVGLRVYGTSESSYIRNIIIQNLKIRNVLATDPATGGGDNDCIGLKWADHVFIDHCELSSDLNSTDWEKFDGLIDISKASDYVTVSWNKLMNSWKGSGVGGSSDSGKDKLHVTYHHNLFQSIGERAPSLGYAKAHIYNNYFLTSAYASGYAVGVRFGSIASVEGNYFEGITNPIKTDIDSGYPGYLSSNKDNIFVSCGSNRGGNPSKTLTLGYVYVLDRAADIPNLIKAKAGATL